MDAAVIDTQMVMESLRLMLIGMSIVFAFLMLLVVLLRAMSWFAVRVGPADFHEMAAGEMPAAMIASTAEAPAADSELIAVLTAAVARYRAPQGG